jgi:hypothetical protein
VSFTSYAFGIVLLLAALVPIAAAAVHIRRRLLPDWAGPPALLVTSILSLAMVLLVSQLLGAVGLFRWWAVLPACTATGIITTLVLRARPAPTGSLRSAPRVDTFQFESITRPIAFVAVAIVLALWVSHTARTSRGVVDLDSLNYHLPFAARFVQTGHTTYLHYTTPGNETPFDPANSELLVAFSILSFHRDVLAPFINLGWMVLALLGAFCIGRARSVGATSLAAVSVLLSAPLMLKHEVASGSNDIAAVALVLAVAAILIESHGRIAAIVVAGVAAGVGIGTKLTLVAPIVVLTVAIMIVAPTRQRVRTLGAWLAPIIVTGSYWYLRNLVRIGNPIPSLHLGIGSLRLPAPRLSAIDLYGQKVSDYFWKSSIWDKFFLPGLRGAFGGSWWVIFALVVVGTLVALVAGDRVTRAFAVVVVASILAYIYTPTSASGILNAPVLFEVNLRYIFPPLGLALALTPVALAPYRRAITQPVVAVAAAVALAGQRDTWAAVVLFAGVLLAITAAWLLPAPRPRLKRGTIAVACAVVVIVAVGGGFFVQRNYLDRRYVNALSPRLGLFNAPALNSIFAWARGVTDARIAVFGTDYQYPLAGLDLSNYVQYIGRRTPNGGFEEATTCREWREAINAGDFDYVVVVAQLRKAPREEGWTSGSGVVPVLIRPGATVFRIVGSLDPGCARE